MAITIYRLPVTSLFQPARTQTTCSQMQAGFLTCALPQDSFPSGTDLQLWTVDKTSFGFPTPDKPRISTNEPIMIHSLCSLCPLWLTFIGTGAHSGATVADLNRVPIFVSRDQTPRNLQLDHLFFKERRQATVLSQESQPKFSDFLPTTTVNPS